MLGSMLTVLATSLPGSSRRPRRLRSVTLLASAVACLAALVVAGCAHTEPPAPPTLSTSFQEDMHLTSSSPVAVRHLTFEATPPKRSLHASLEVSALKVGSDGTPQAAKGLTVSVVPDDLVALGGVGSGSHNFAAAGSTLDLNDYCLNGCRGGITVIVRRSAEDGPDQDYRLLADLNVSGWFSDQQPLGTTLTVAVDTDPTFEGTPSSVTASAVRTIEVSQDAPTAHLEVPMHIDSRVLDAPLGYPLVGSLTLRASGAGESQDLFRGGSFGLATVNGHAVGIGAGNPVDVNWLRFCTAGSACDVTIGIDITYANVSRVASVNTAVDGRTLAALPSSFTLEVSVVALLEAFDNRALPSGSVILGAE